jgi:hypothetical protein
LRDFRSLRAARPDATAGRRREDPRVTRSTSYAVSWREEGTRLVGRLELGPRQLRIEGRSGTAFESSRVVAYGEIVDVATRRAGGQRVLELVLRGGHSIVVASLDGAGSLLELATELRSRTARPHPESGGAPMIAPA